MNSDYWLLFLYFACEIIQLLYIHDFLLLNGEISGLCLVSEKLHMVRRCLELVRPFSVLLAFFVVYENGGYFMDRERDPWINLR